MAGSIYVDVYFSDTTEFASFTGTADTIRTAGYYAPGDGGGAFYTRTNTGAPAIIDGSGRSWYLQDVLGDKVSILQFGALLSTSGNIQDMHTGWAATDAFATTYKKTVFIPAPCDGYSWHLLTPMVASAPGIEFEQGCTINTNLPMAVFVGSVSGNQLTVSSFSSGTQLYAGQMVYTSYNGGYTERVVSVSGSVATLASTLLNGITLQNFNTDGTSALTVSVNGTIVINPKFAGQDVIPGIQQAIAAGMILTQAQTWITSSGNTATIAAPPTAVTFTGYATNGVLTVTGIPSGYIWPQGTLTGGSTGAGTTVYLQTAGTAGAGSNATYLIYPAQTIGFASSQVSFTLTYTGVAGNILTNAAQVTCSAASGLLTVTGNLTGLSGPNATISGGGFQTDTLGPQLTGTPGGAGAATYQLTGFTVKASAASSGSPTITVSSTASVVDGQTAAGLTAIATVASSGSPTISVASTANIANGQAASGTGIPGGTTVVSFVTNTSITFSQNVTVNANETIYLGGIPAGTTVVSFVANTSITFSQNVTVTLNQVIALSQNVNGPVTATLTWSNATQNPNQNTISGPGMAAQAVGLGAQFAALLSGTANAVGATYSFTGAAQTIPTAIPVWQTTLPNYSAFEPGTAAMNIAGQTVLQNPRSTTTYKIGVYVTTNQGHCSFEGGGPSGWFGYRVQNNSYNFHWDDAGSGGVWASLLVGTSNIVGSNGGCQGNWNDFQFALNNAYGILQLQDAAYSGSPDGLGGGLVGDSSFESCSEAAIQMLPGAANSLHIADTVTQQWSAEILPPSLTPTPQYALFNLGSLLAFTTGPNAADTGTGAWSASNISPVGTSSYPKYSIVATVLPRTQDIVNLDYFDSNRLLTGSFARYYPNTRYPIDPPTMGTFGVSKSMADVVNLFANPEQNISPMGGNGLVGGGGNWSIAAGSPTVTIYPFAFSPISGLTIPQSVTEVLGNNPAVIAVTIASSGSISLPAIASLANVGLTVPIWMRFYHVQTGATGAQLSYNITTTDGSLFHLYNGTQNFTGQNVFSEVLGVDRNLGSISSTTGTLSKLTLGLSSAGTVYFLGVMAGKNILGPYNPLSMSYSPGGVATGDPTGALVAALVPQTYADPLGNYVVSAPIGDSSGKSQLPVASNTYTIPQLCANYHLTNSASVAGVTLIVPTPPTTLTNETIELNVYFDGPLTTLAWTAPTGITFTGAALPAAVAAGNVVSLRYFPTTSTTGKWFHKAGI